MSGQDEGDETRADVQTTAGTPQAGSVPGTQSAGGSMGGGGGVDRTGRDESGTIGSGIGNPADTAIRTGGDAVGDVGPQSGQGSGTTEPDAGGTEG